MESGQEIFGVDVACLCGRGGWDVRIVPAPAVSKKDSKKKKRRFPFKKFKKKIKKNKKYVPWYYTHVLHNLSSNYFILPVTRYST